ncbi:MAG TPA: SMC-Scp complex subunit ScpB [Gammaproteobacteria bacterium]|nr:SMC-Scp complex subunit ScpB [Gammaproteobacteria bacterium]
MSIEMNLQALLEAILLAAAKPLTEEQLLNLFEEEERPSIDVLREALGDLQNACEMRGIELIEVASGYRFQVKQKWVPWVGKLWDEKPQKYSRALLETLALIAYRQPITRGEIEDIRGVAVSTSIFKTLLEDREWIRMVGHKEVPGRPALFATTKGFLDYFGLKSLQELPSLPDIMNLETGNLDLLEQPLLPIPEIESQLTAECLEIAEMEEMEDVETE